MVLTRTTHKGIYLCKITPFFVKRKKLKLDQTIYRFYLETPLDFRRAFITERSSFLLIHRIGY